jgi:uncharacterized protein (TIGR02679 family)
MSAGCPFCDDACAEAELGPLLGEQLRWLWEQVARAADRRGDAQLAQGTLTIRAPDLPEARAVAVGLLGGRVLKPGQSRTVDLAQLTLKLRVRGPYLTPGAVAAHVTGRRLATRAAEEAERQQQLQHLMEEFLAAAATLSREVFREPDRIWAALRRNGWVARVLNTERPSQLLRNAIAVVGALSFQNSRIDRRRLAADTTGNPHALDSGTTLAGLVLAILAASGKVKPKQRPRLAWTSVGVDCDDVTGGLVAVGILPIGWSLPAGATVILPPRVLNACRWPPPQVPGSWVFVTENPSVASAAADLAANAAEVRLLCTSGTPSAEEISAIARLASIGWRVAVRADFDAAGLSHVTALLEAVPNAVAWRMSADDYLGSLAVAGADEVALERVPDVHWDRRLSATMREKGIAAYEESLLPLLLEDLRRGIPGLVGDRRFRTL